MEACKDEDIGMNIIYKGTTSQRGGRGKISYGDIYIYIYTFITHTYINIYIYIYNAYIYTYTYVYSIYI